MTGPKITDLAFELLHQIMLLVPHRMPKSSSGITSRLLGKDWGYPLREDSEQLVHLALLRTTCRAFDAAIQPILFSEVSIDCLYTRFDIVVHQLSCFEDDNPTAPWNYYTRKLRIVNLDAFFDKTVSAGGVQYLETHFSPEQREQTKKMKSMVQERLLLSLRKGLPRLESLRWFVRIGDPVEPLVAHFSQLPALESLELVFWNDKVFPNFPLDAFSNLTKLGLFFFHSPGQHPILRGWVNNARGFFERLHKVIEASPSLESLQIGKRFRYEIYNSSELEDRPMFPSELLLSSSGARNLHHLALRRFDLVRASNNTGIPTTFYPKLFAHLASLTSVDFTGSKSSTERAVWWALLDSNVLLTSIRVDYVNDSLVTYISQPKVPLESLTLLLERLDEDVNWKENGNLPRRIYTTVLEVHSGRLRHLDVQTSGQTFWGLECLESPGQAQAIKPTPAIPTPAPGGEGDAAGSDSFGSLNEPRDAPVLLEETFLFQCQQLQSLGLAINFQRALTSTGTRSLIPGAIEKRVTKFLKQMFAHMPQLDTVTIYPPEWRSYGFFSNEARENARKAIQELTVTEKDRANAHFDVIFDNSRYELRIDPVSNGRVDCAGDNVEETSTGLQWKFFDINAE